MKFGWSAWNSQGTCPWPRTTFPEDGKSLALSSEEQARHEKMCQITTRATGHWWLTIFSRDRIEGPLNRLPLKNWIWANLLKTNRGPAPWWVQHPLKMVIPYHHPPWSSAGVSKCAKSHPELLAINEVPFICGIYKMTKNFVAFDLPNVTIPLTALTE